MYFHTVVQTLVSLKRICTCSGKQMFNNYFAVLKGPRALLYSKPVHKYLSKGR